MRVLYLIRGDDSENLISFRDRILDFTRRSLVPLASTVVIAVTEEKPSLLSVIPFRKDPIALVSLGGVDKNADWPKPPPGFSGAFQSDVTFPVEHRRDWSLGERSPGAGLLTLFRKRRRLTDEEFISRWYDGHTPLTLEVHPNAGYVRNRITGPYNDAGPTVPEWDGIVEEQYDPAADLLNPIRFFGGTLWKMPTTMFRVFRDVLGFIDYSSIHTWLTAEYRLK